MPSSLDMARDSSTNGIANVDLMKKLRSQPVRRVLTTA